jgi:lysophospholipase L1-like esterase
VFKPLAAGRLAALNRLCETHGAHFLFVVPPTYQEGEETIVEAGREDGVTVLLPVKRNEFDQSYYQKDGFHMNQKGAEIFTARVAAELNKELP